MDVTADPAVREQVTESAAPAPTQTVCDVAHALGTKAGVANFECEIAAPPEMLAFVTVASAAVCMWDRAVLRALEVMVSPVLQVLMALA
jgi:hypothetical protein